MSEKKCDVSIIIPVFNGEYYIDRLLQNLTEQTYQNFEAIFVNDGSTDCTAQKLDFVKDAGYPFDITVVHQENGGVSVARNRGLSVASGEYICFIDADDVISCDYLMLLRESLRCSGTDIVMGYITRDLQKFDLRSDTVAQVFDKNAFLREFLYRGIRFSICAAMFSKACFKKYSLLFPEGYRYSEDVYLLWQLFAREERIAVLPCPIYFYYDNPVSAMNRTIGLDRKQAIELMEKLEPVMQKYAPDFGAEFCQFAVARHHWSILWQAACMFSSFKEFKEYAGHFEMKRELQKLFIYPQRSISWSSRLYCASPWMYYHLIRFYKRPKKKL